MLWNLRLKAAERGIWKSAEMRRRLAAERLMISILSPLYEDSFRRRAAAVCRDDHVHFTHERPFNFPILLWHP